MQRFHFHEYLNTDFINGIASRHRFAQKSFIEKYLMDFEILYAISQHLPYVLKGGMAMPFHIKDNRLRRLSEDVDLFTNEEPDAIQKAIDQINKEYGGRLTLSLYEPEKKARSLPLKAYDVYYDSCLDGKKHRISLEILHGWDGRLRDETVTQPINILGFTVDFPVKLLSNSSLFVDKLTTLAFGTIGLLPEKQSNTPKQVYDIAGLLRILSVDSLNESRYSYSQAAEFQCEIQTLSYDAKTILKGTLETIDSMFVMDHSIGLANAEREHFRGFAGQMIGGNIQTITDHIVDLLTIRLCAAKILEAIDQSTEISITSETLRSITASEDEIAGSDPSKTKGDLLKSLAGDSKLQKLSRGLQLKPLSLICEIQQTKYKFRI